MDVTLCHFQRRQRREKVYLYESVKDFDSCRWSWEAACFCGALIASSLISGTLNLDVCIEVVTGRLCFYHRLLLWCLWACRARVRLVCLWFLCSQRTGWEEKSCTDVKWVYNGHKTWISVRQSLVISFLFFSAWNAEDSSLAGRQRLK